MKIVFAGGGTAGHIEPALAVARLWQQNHPSDDLEFIGTARGLENQLVPAAGFKLGHIPKVVIPRKPSLKLFQAPITLTSSFLASRKLLAGADLLIGFGGYVSAPAYLAAKSLRIPFIVHEANAKPGFANRLGALLTPYCAIAQSVSAGSLQKALITGIPLRNDVAKALHQSASDWSGSRARAKSALGFSPTQPLILAFFGSQGSVALNKIISQSLPSLLGSGSQLLHAVGKLNALPPMQERYKSTAYIEEMATAYLAADLIISRSGAISCSEINALGKYALFIPLPIGNGEQSFNAGSLVSQGRAEVLEQKYFTSAWLKSNITRLLSLSSSAEDSGSDSDVLATEKIVNYMQYALKNQVR
jgi:UDP-N-acetylglucosamine--N-acetylmuramyl-(pentapeptide) pyrophosphoryl-undecaprenol N-acetylglucosamine transferase